MALRYPDKNWKQNQLNKLKPEDGETTITRAVFDRWEGHSDGVFKAMKIAFFPRMATNLQYANGTFSPLVAGTAQDFVTTTAFRKQVVTLAVAAGFTFADPADNGAPIDDARFARNYEEIIDILVDVNVQLSTSIQDKKLNLVFKTKREADHPLMPL